MKPISTCEKPSFRALITGLTSDNFVPDRRAISNLLLNKYKTYVTDLTNLISEKTYVCITTDIWSSLNKSYLGMTLHYIEEKSYNRFSYVLACQRIEGSHNYSNIAKCISKVMNSYKINVTKITHTVTDNASNFGKAFRVYAQQFAPPETVSKNNVTLDTQNINILMDAFDQNTEHNFELESGFLQNDVENEPDDIIDVVNVSDILTIASNNYNEYSEDNDDLDIILSNHITCSAHTLNLVATIDTSKITNNQYKMISRSAFGKLTAFWNLVSRSTMASDLVFNICKCKFPIPVITRWNSFYDAIKKIMICREKIIECFEKLKLSQLKTTEWNFLEEYIKVMQPLTTALDKLQGEKSCYLGYVAPTIIAIRRILLNQSHLTYCKPLSLSIIKGLEKRYSFIFDLNDPKSKPYILSSVTLPKFKLSWVPSQFSDICKNLFLLECNEVSSIMNTESGPSTTDNDSGDEFYTPISNSQLSTSSLESSNQHRCENLASVQGLSYLNSKKKDGKDLIILDHYPIVKHIFFKYNTTLPSSAPVERLFSNGTQILTPRRNRLSDKTFEMLMCLKSNKFNV